MNSTLSDPFFIALKASVAAVLALAVVRLAGIPDTLSATFVAVVCISPTVFSALREGLEQVVASAIGGVLAWALSFVLPSAAVLAIALFVTIWLCFRLGLARAYAVAAFTSLYVLLLPGSAVSTLEFRIASVAVGVGSAVLVNLVVSALGYRRVFSRRLRIARTQLGGEYARLAQALEAEGAGRGPLAGQALFESSFPLLRTLVQELTDAARDSRLLGGRALERMTSAVRAAELLIRVAHHGAELALISAESRGPLREAAASARRLSQTLRDCQRLEAPAAVEPACTRAIQAAVGAWNQACAEEARFGQP